jgi:DNA-binding NarL/FixJ family response regulator
MINLLLVDDHKIIRDGIRALLGDATDIEIKGECEGGEEVIPFLEKNAVDIILMDISMPVQGGIQTTELVVEKYPDIKIIALSMHSQESYISKMLKAGAAGYVLKNTGVEDITNAIRTVASGQNYFSEDVSEIMMAKFMKKQSTNYSSATMSSVEDLTARELDVIKLVADGLTNNSIAEKLFLSPRTIDTHRRNLLQKLGVNNTAGLVRFAFENNLID